MECGVIADSGYFSVAYPHLSGNFYAKHQAEVILNSTLSPNSIPVRQHKVEGVINSTLLTVQMFACSRLMWETSLPTE